jgi:hypothetical protein
MKTTEITSDQIAAWCLRHMRELWRVDDNHCTIDISCCDGTLRYQIHHDTLGSTDWHSSIEDAKRSLVSEIKMQPSLVGQFNVPQDETQAAETANNPF